MKYLLILLCLALTACGYKVGLTPAAMEEAQRMCLAHGGVDTVNNTAVTTGLTAFDATCIDGAEVSYQKGNSSR
jgi:hypothetical protein